VHNLRDRSRIGAVLESRRHARQNPFTIAAIVGQRLQDAGLSNAVAFLNKSGFIEKLSKGHINESGGRP
jgi:hypothetical protein